MKTENTHAVTGAFGYSGKYIAQRLLAEGNEVVTLIGKRRPVISVPPTVGYSVGWLLGKLVGDVLITKEEVAGLMANLLCVDSPPAGTTGLTDWARARASTLGLHYTSELARRKDRETAYTSN